MEDNENKAGLIESLIELIKEYGKTTYELFKHKAIDKTSNVVSIVISRLCSLVVLFIFILILNIGVALWLGELLGKNYYGFFCIAGFDGLLWMVLHFLMYNRIKKNINDSIISKVFN